MNHPILPNDAHIFTKIVVLAQDFRMFGQSGRFLWHYSRLFGGVSDQRGLDILEARIASDGRGSEEPLRRGASRQYGAPILSRSSVVSFVFRRYKIVLSLDLSESMWTLDETTGGVLYDALVEQVELLLTGLVVPMGYTPDVLVSCVAAHIGLLVQGFLLTAENVDTLVGELLSKLDAIESDLAGRQDGDHAAHGLGELAIHGAFRALELLPADACPLIVLFTDGVSAALPGDAGFRQLASADTPLHVVKVNSTEPDQPHAFGYVADASLLKFVAQRAGGSFFDPEALLVSASQHPTAATYTTHTNAADIDDGADGAPFGLFDDAGTGQDVTCPSELQQALLWRYSNFGPRPPLPGHDWAMPSLEISAGRSHGYECDHRRDSPFDEAAIRAANAGATASNHAFPYVGRAPPVCLVTDVVTEYMYDIVPVDHVRFLDCRVREGFRLHEFRIRLLPRDSVGVGLSTVVVTAQMQLLWAENIIVTYVLTHSSLSSAATSSGAVHPARSTAAISKRDLLSRAFATEGKGEARVQLRLTAPLGFCREYRDLATRTARINARRHRRKEVALAPRSMPTRGALPGRTGVGRTPGEDECWTSFSGKRSPVLLSQFLRQSVQGADYVVWRLCKVSRYLAVLGQDQLSEVSRAPRSSKRSQMWGAGSSETARALKRQLREQQEERQQQIDIQRKESLLQSPWYSRKAAAAGRSAAAAANERKSNYATKRAKSRPATLDSAQRQCFSFLRSLTWNECRRFCCESSIDVFYRQSPFEHTRITCDPTFMRAHEGVGILEQVCLRISTCALCPGTYLKYLAIEGNSEIGATAAGAFCLLRPRWRTSLGATVHMAFFAAPAKTRQYFFERLQRELAKVRPGELPIRKAGGVATPININSTSSSVFHVCPRPVIRALVRLLPTSGSHSDGAASVAQHTAKAAKDETPPEPGGVAATVGHASDAFTKYRKYRQFQREKHRLVKCIEFQRRRITSSFSRGGCMLLRQASISVCGANSDVAGSSGGRSSGGPRQGGTNRAVGGRDEPPPGQDRVVRQHRKHRAFKMKSTNIWTFSSKAAAIAIMKVLKHARHNDGFILADALGAPSSSDTPCRRWFNYCVFVREIRLRRDAMEVQQSDGIVQYAIRMVPPQSADDHLFMVKSEVRMVVALRDGKEKEVWTRLSSYFSHTDSQCVSACKSLQHARETLRGRGNSSLSRSGLSTVQVASMLPFSTWTEERYPMLKDSAGGPVNGALILSLLESSLALLCDFEVPWNNTAGRHVPVDAHTIQHPGRCFVVVVRTGTRIEDASVTIVLLPSEGSFCKYFPIHYFHLKHISRRTCAAAQLRQLFWVAENEGDPCHADQHPLVGAQQLILIKERIRRQYDQHVCRAAFEALRHRVRLSPETVGRAVQQCAVRSCAAVSLSQLHFARSQRPPSSDETPPDFDESFRAILEKYICRVPRTCYFVPRNDFDEERCASDGNGGDGDNLPRPLCEPCFVQLKLAAAPVDVSDNIFAAMLSGGPLRIVTSTLTTAVLPHHANALGVPNSEVGGDSLPESRRDGDAASIASDGSGMEADECDGRRRRQFRRLQRDLQELMLHQALDMLRLVVNELLEPDEIILDTVATMLMRSNRSNCVARFGARIHFVDANLGLTLFSAALEALPCGSFVSDGAPARPLTLSQVGKRYFVVCLDEKSKVHIPFWCVVDLVSDFNDGSSSSVMASGVFHYPDGSLAHHDRFTLPKRIISGLQQLALRINQIVLLKRIYDTRAANALVIVEDACKDVSGDTAMFSPGAFACPLLASHLLQLHPRLPSHVAIGHLGKSMRSLAIKNRENYFVVSAKHYFRLVDGGGGPGGTSVMLQMFGVDPPDPEATKGLLATMKSRLDALVMKVLSSHIARATVACELTPMDHAFVSSGSVKSCFRMPRAVVRTAPPQIYLRLIRESLLEYLGALEGNEMAFVYNDGIGIAIVHIRCGSGVGPTDARALRAKLPRLPWNVTELETAQSPTNCVACEISFRGPMSPYILLSRIILSSTKALYDYVIEHECFPHIRAHENSCTAPTALLEPVLALLGAANLSPTVWRFAFNRTGTNAPVIPAWALPEFADALAALVAEAEPRAASSAGITVALCAGGEDHGQYCPRKMQGRHGPSSGYLCDDPAVDLPPHVSRAFIAAPRYDGRRPGYRFLVRGPNGAASGYYRDTRRQEAADLRRQRRRAAPRIHFGSANYSAPTGSLVRKGPGQYFVFRERGCRCFVLATVRGRQAEVFVYGRHLDLVVCRRRVTRVLGWVVAREHFLSAVAHQKMGLAPHVNRKGATVDVSAARGPMGHGVSAEGSADEALHRDHNFRRHQVALHAAVCAAACPGVAVDDYYGY